MNILIILILMLASISNIYSAGHPDYFLDLGISAGAIGMGRASVTEGDISSIYWNSGALSRIDRLQVSSNYTHLYDDVKCLSVAFGLPQYYLQSGFLGISYLRLSAQNIEFRDAQDFLKGKFDDTHQALLLSYGHLLYDKVPIGLGITGKYISQEMLENKISAFDMDCGLFIEPFSRLKLGVNSKNIFNSKMNGKYSSEELPTRRVFGINLNLSEKTEMVFDYEKMFKIEEEEFRLGMKVNNEYGCGMYGLRVSHEKEEYNLKSFSIGIKLLFGKTPLSLAYEFYFKNKREHKVADFKGDIISFSLSYYGSTKEEKIIKLKKKLGNRIKERCPFTANKIAKKILKLKKDDTFIINEVSLLKESLKDQENPTIEYKLNLKKLKENIYITTNTKGVNIEIKASDNFGVSEIKISGDEVEVYEKVTEEQTEGWRWSEPSLAKAEDAVTKEFTLPEGESKVNLTVAVLDFNKNAAKSDFTIKVDTSPPEIKDVKIYKHKLTFNCKDDYALDKIEIKNTEERSITEFCKNKKECSFEDTDLKKQFKKSGEITIKVFDLAGNCTEIKHYYDRTPPTVNAYIRKSKNEKWSKIGQANVIVEEEYSLKVNAEDHGGISGIEIKIGDKSYSPEVNAKKEVLIKGLNDTGKLIIRVSDSQGNEKTVNFPEIVK